MRSCPVSPLVCLSPSDASDEEPLGHCFPNWPSISSWQKQQWLGATKLEEVSLAPWHSLLSLSFPADMTYVLSGSSYRWSLLNARTPRLSIDAVITTHSRSPWPKGADLLLVAGADWWFPWTFHRQGGAWAVLFPSREKQTLEHHRGTCPAPSNLYTWVAWNHSSVRM